MLSRSSLLLAGSTNRRVPFKPVLFLACILGSLAVQPIETDQGAAEHLERDRVVPEDTPENELTSGPRPVQLAGPSPRLIERLGTCAEEKCDTKNDYTYDCSTGGTYAVYNAKTLTYSQKHYGQAELWPGMQPSGYACVQGCAGNCEKTSTKSEVVLGGFAMWRYKYVDHDAYCKINKLGKFGPVDPLTTTCGSFDEVCPKCSCGRPGTSCPDTCSMCPLDSDPTAPVTYKCSRSANDCPGNPKLNHPR